MKFRFHIKATGFFNQAVKHFYKQAKLNIISAKKNKFLSDFVFSRPIFFLVPLGTPVLPCHARIEWAVSISLGEKTISHGARVSGNAHSKRYLLSIKWKFEDAGSDQCLQNPIKLVSLYFYLLYGTVGTYTTNNTH